MQSNLLFTALLQVYLVYFVVHEYIYIIYNEQKQNIKYSTNRKREISIIDDWQIISPTHSVHNYDCSVLLYP